MEWLGCTQILCHFPECQIFPLWTPPANLLLSCRSSRWFTEKLLYSEFELHCQNTAFAHICMQEFIRTGLSPLLYRSPLWQIGFVLWSWPDFYVLLRNIQCSECRWKLLTISHPLQFEVLPMVLKMTAHVLWLNFQQPVLNFT